MAFDKGKIIADYEKLKDNEFWKFFWDTVNDKQQQIVNVLVSADDLPSVYRAQGKIAAMGLLTRLPEDIVSRLKG
jgi:hypothetical protein